MDIVMALLLLVIPLSLFFILVHSMAADGKDSVDTSAFLFCQSVVSPLCTKFATIVTFFGTGSFLIPSYLLLVVYLLRNNLARYARMVAVTVMSGLVLGWLLKDLFRRPRPLHPLVSGAGGYSFPSGHALGAFIFSGILLFLLWQTRKATFAKWLLSLPVAALGIMVGLSRIYLHVHYATDVIGSLLVTLVWFSLSNIFIRFICIDRQLFFNFRSLKLYTLLTSLYQVVSPADRKME